MSAQDKYEKLVRKWGRELANEIFAKQHAALANQPIGKSNKKKSKQAKAKKKKGPDALDSWARLPGSFEGGKKQ